MYKCRLDTCMSPKFKNTPIRRGLSLGSTVAYPALSYCLKILSQKLGFILRGLAGYSLNTKGGQSACMLDNWIVLGHTSIGNSDAIKSPSCRRIVSAMNTGVTCLKIAKFLPTFCTRKPPKISEHFQVNLKLYYV